MISPEDQDVTEFPKSRTRKKKEDHIRQILGERLVMLSADQLECLGLPDEVREAVLLAGKTIPHGARHRQVKYIGALLRQMDTVPIEKALNDIARGDKRKMLAFKNIESWRDRLREGDTAVVEEILTACPLARRQQLTQLVRNVKKEVEGNKGVKASRALFRYLKEVSEN